MVLSDDFFVDIDGAIGVSVPLVLDIEVALFPCLWGISVDILLNLGLIQEPSNPQRIKTRYIPLLLDTLTINIPNIRPSIKEPSLNRAQHLLTLKIIIQTLLFIQVIDLIRYEIVTLQVVNSELAEILVCVALVALCTGVVEKESAQLDFEPCGGVGVAVQLDDDLCDSWRDYACVLLACEVHGLVFELGEFLVEFLDSQVVELGYCVVVIGSIGTLCESDLTRALNKE